MNERACQFGPQDSLFGILSEPAAQGADPGAPAVLLLNAGLLHRVGPHRMSVSLARRLADCGIRSLRFDMGGYGDSALEAQAGSEDDRVVSDIKSAMDFMERECGVRRFILFGTCSGADNSHAVALIDPRVAGAVLLDAQGYPTRRSAAIYYLVRAVRLRVWRNLLRRLLSRRRESAEKRVTAVPDLRRPFGPRAQVEREIQSLVDRGVRLLFVYSGGVETYYNYAGQFFDQFPGLVPGGRIEVEFYPDADHTYTFAEDRERMFTRVVDWCRRLTTPSEVRRR